MSAEHRRTTRETRRATASPMTISRRGLLTGVAGAAGALALSRGGWVAGDVAAEEGEPEDGASSGIEHIVLVMMENRSFDHFLGWLPHAEGRQAGLSYADKAGVRHPTYPLAPDYQGCGHPDPDHSYSFAVHLA